MEMSSKYFYIFIWYIHTYLFTTRRDTMENLIVQEFTENGIIGLDQGLKNILAKASDLQRTNS